MMPVSKSRGALLSGLLLASSSLVLPGVANAATLPGPLYKLASTPTVYVDHNGSLHAIASPAMLNDLGYTWNDLKTVTTLPAPVGAPITLLKPQSSAQVYLYQKGQLHWIESAKVFNQNGFQWSNVYAVSQLPAPIGSPITGTVTPTNTVPPAASYKSLSAFPYIAAGGTKTIAIDALNTNGSIDTTYHGNLTVSSSTSHVTFKTAAGRYTSGPLSVAFTNGVGLLTVKAGSTTGNTSLRWSNGELNLTVLPNSTSQVGWRAYTASGVPVSSVHPVTSGAKLILEPVDAQGAIVPDTSADNVSLYVNSNAPFYLGYVNNMPFGGPPSLMTAYASASTNPSYTFTGSAFNSNLGVNSSYPATFPVSPNGPANVKVTGVSGSSSSAAPVVSNPVSNSIGQLQLVNGIQADHTYSVQLQLETSNNQPILGIAQLLLSQAYPTTSASNQSPNFTVSKGGRTTPSTLTFGHLGTNHVYLTYHTGSAHNVPDVLSLYGTQNVASGPPNQIPDPIVELATNAF